MRNIPIIVLAAGQSRRMGEIDKLMQPIDGEPLLARVVDRAMHAGPVLVTLPPEPHPRYGALAKLDARRIPVQDAEEGMNASLRCAVAALPDQIPAVMVVLADMPDLTVSDMKKILEAFESKTDSLVVRGATEDGAPGHPVLFSKELFPALTRLSGDDGAHTLVKAHADRVTLVPLPGTHARLDLDTPEDWDNWLAGT